MDIVLFGGNSQRNQEWIHGVGNTVAPDFNRTIVHDYAHWNGIGPSIDFELELATLTEELDGLDEYVVFAKSVGSILTLKGIALGILQPTQCVFAGLPIQLAIDDEIPLQELLVNNHIPTVFLQNTDDPLASYAKLVSYIQQSGADECLTVELPGSTHSYDDLEKIKLILKSFT